MSVVAQAIGPVRSSTRVLRDRGGAGKTRDVDGPGTIETYSVRYDWPVRTGIIVGRRDADGSRFLAVTTDDDLVALMSDGDPLGARIQLRCSDGINRAAVLPR